MRSIHDKKPAGFVVAAPSSASGKTSITLGIMEALRRRKFHVQPFKAGPDYIDPGLHSALIGAPSYNLDTWMMGTTAVRKTFGEKSVGAISVVEGVMGLYDGRGASQEGSTAHLAKLLRLPVLLVINAEKMSRSVGAMIKGFVEYDRSVDIRWVVFNNVGSLRHFEILKKSIPVSVKVSCLGYVPKNVRLSLPSRHLGLTGSDDLKAGDWRNFVDAAAMIMEENLDLDKLIGSISILKKTISPDTARSQALRPGCTIAVARDRAFSFYYQENLEMLERLGGRIRFFSPIKDKTLPKGAQAVYLGGGYPELYARELSENVTLRNEVRAFVESGSPVYAECGGIMYLSRSIKTATGERYKMAGAFKMDSIMLPGRKALGYREVRVKKGCPFLNAGKLRGHEFHYSELSGTDSRLNSAFEVLSKKGKADKGFVYKNTLATYIHMHFASNPAFARGFVRSAAVAKKD